MCAAIACAGVVAGCTTDERGLPTGRLFDNRTGVVVTVVWARESGERVTQATLQPGGTADVTMNKFGNPNEVCGDGDLVALDAAGRELIRTPASCGRWVIRVPALRTADVVDRTWVLTALVQPDGSERPPALASTLIWSSSGDFTIRTGCRTLVGTWSAGADAIGPTTSRVADETAACTGAAASQDADVTDIAGKRAAVQVDGGSLTLFADSGAHRDWQLRYEVVPGG